MALLFFMTPILYPPSVVPDTIWFGLPVRAIIEWNPLTLFVDAIRDSMYLLQVPSMSRWTILVITSLGLWLIGLAVFERYGTRVSEDM